jgi:hypothetical protein
MPAFGTSGRRDRAEPCPLLGVKQTLRLQTVMSTFDPKRTWTLCKHNSLHMMLMQVHR